MAHLPQYSYPGIGEWAKENLHYSQAVRVGDTIVCSGQGGWNPTTFAIPKDLDAEVDQAFENVETNLKHAGGRGWSQVYRVTTYSTDLKGTHDRIVQNYRRWMPDHYPVWTEIGVNKLGLDEMHIEIEVSAHDPEGAEKGKSSRRGEKESEKSGT
ncbi:YjgF-like protein [Xylariomycetidae sp. FL2044]|nr:YjgF-like protein [Xylariomycetidae sp. FL2044]